MKTSSVTNSSESNPRHTELQDYPLSRDSDKAEFAFRSFGVPNQSKPSYGFVTSAIKALCAAAWVSGALRLAGDFMPTARANGSFHVMLILRDQDKEASDAAQ